MSSRSRYEELKARHQLQMQANLPSKKPQSHGTPRSDPTQLTLRTEYGKRCLATLSFIHDDPSWHTIAQTLAEFVWHRTLGELCNDLLCFKVDPLGKSRILIEWFSDFLIDDYMDEFRNDLEDIQLFVRAFLSDDTGIQINVPCKINSRKVKHGIAMHIHVAKEVMGLQLPVLNSVKAKDAKHILNIGSRRMTFEDKLQIVEAWLPSRVTVLDLGSVSTMGRKREPQLISNAKEFLDKIESIINDKYHSHDRILILNEDVHNAMAARGLNFIDSSGKFLCTRIQNVELKVKNRRFGISIADLLSDF